MALIEIAYVKDNFPQWGDYCTGETGEPDQTILQKEIDLSIVKFSEYLNIAEADISEALKLHLLNIVRKRCWQRRQGDTEYQHPPQIVQDYNDTIKTLAGIKEGKISLSPATTTTPKDTVVITAKEKRYSNSLWFNEDWK